MLISVSPNSDVPGCTTIHVDICYTVPVLNTTFFLKISLRVSKHVHVEDIAKI